MSESMQIEVTIDTARDQTFATDISARLISFELTSGQIDPYGEVAPPCSMTAVFDNGDGAFNQDQTTNAYYGKINQGVLVRLRIAWGGTWYTRFIGWISGATPLNMDFGAPVRRMQLQVVDASQRIMESEYNPPLQTSVTTDAPLTEMFDNGIIVAYPYDASFFILDASTLDGTDVLYGGSSGIISFETGKTTLDFAGDVEPKPAGTSPIVLIDEMVHSEAGGRFYYDPRQPKYVFHNRHHDIENAGATYAVNANQCLATSYRQSPIYNSASVRYEPRSLGSAGSTLFTSQSVPFKIGFGQSRTLTVRYTDPNTPTAQISASTVIQPVAGTDIIANSQSDGGGTDYSSVVGYAINTAATSTTVMIRNNTSVDIYITKLQIRGTPLVRAQIETAEYTDGPSMRAYNFHPLSVVDGGAISDAVFAQQYARQLVARYATAGTELASLSIEGDKDAARAALALGVEVGDQLDFTDFVTNHVATYVVVGIQERKSEEEPGAPFIVNWILKPFDRVNVFTLDVSSLDGTAVLAF